MFSALARFVRMAASRDRKTAPVNLPRPVDGLGFEVRLLPPTNATPVRDAASMAPGPGTLQELCMSQVQTEAKPTVTRNQAVGWLRQMLLIRRFEERAEMMYQQGRIGGFFHQYSGQEPVAVGS